MAPLRYLGKFAIWQPCSGFGSGRGAGHHGTEVHDDVQVEGLEDQVQELEARAIPQHVENSGGVGALVP